MSDILQILEGDAIEQLRTLPADSVQCVVTSPPYWALRDYGVDGQIGMEESFPEFLEKLIGVFREVRRVLRSDGTCWVNMGDSYAGSWGAQGRSGEMSGRSVVSARQIAAAARRESGTGSSRRTPGIKPKDLVGQPWRLAFAMQDDGWWLRRDIIWHKPNPMPESAKDRPTTAHEYVFLMTKAESYFYNKAEAREPVTGTANPRGDGVNRKIAGWAEASGSHAAVDHARPFNGIGFGHGTESKPRWNGPRTRQNESFSAAVTGLVDDRNYRSVWTIATQAFPGSHFATFPEALAKRCIIAGTRPGDTVLDPFGGSGTTGAVAIELGRRATLVEINPDYVKLIRQRCAITPGLGI